MLNFQNPEMTQILTLTYGDINNILQGLGVGPGSATERWLCRKIAQKSAFFRD